MLQTYSSYKKPSTPTSTLKDLKSGKIPPTRTVNLRGMTLSEVEDFLLAYIESLNNYQCILIIHGQGMKSPERIPIIKNYVYDQLPKSSKVLAMCKALQKDGGAGASYILVGKTHLHQTN
ncbi:Smr/MutS family protein [Gammaproteobacteria bacterium]|nr:Smr/MutS family protein [Gammaproteobacteria bacterium]